MTALQTGHIHTQKLQAFSRSLPVPAPALPSSARGLTILLGSVISGLLAFATSLSEALRASPTNFWGLHHRRPSAKFSGRSPMLHFTGATNLHAELNKQGEPPCWSLRKSLGGHHPLRCSLPCAQPVFTNSAKTPVSFPFGRARQPSRLWPYKEKYGGFQHNGNP